MLSKYVTQQDIDDIKNASTFEQLFEIAKRILLKMPEDSIGVCDPISNHPSEPAPPKVKDGTEKPAPYVAACRKLIEEGYPVFDESIFFKKINELKSMYFDTHPGKETCTDIVEKFFKPLLQTGRIKVLLVLPNLDTLYVPYWEETHAHDFNITVTPLPFQWEKMENLGRIIKLPPPPTETNSALVPTQVA